MKKKITIGGAVTLALMMATVTFIMTMIYAQSSFDSRVYNIKERETMYAKLAEVDQLVRRDFYRDVDDTALMDELVTGYLNGLDDRNAKYQTNAQYKESLSILEGTLVGIGTEFTQDASGYIRITNVYPDSPAELMELAVGDLIVKVADLAVTVDNYADAVAAISGEAGTTVTLTIHHEGTEKILTITRRKVDIATVTYKLIDTIGHITIDTFTERTSSEFSSAIASLFNYGATGLVIDLRKNSSGSVDEMLDVADRLVSGGDMLFASYRGGKKEVLRTANDSNVDLPMAVLIGPSTSGAAELLAQILRDFDKAMLVGTTSAGNGSMTETLLLSDGSAVTVTIALYETPASPSFDGVGIKPDYDIKLTADQEEILDQLDISNDPQLRKAVEAAGGSIRYDSPIEEAPIEQEGEAVEEGEEEENDSSEA